MNFRPERYASISGRFAKNGLNLNGVVLNLLLESYFHIRAHPFELLASSLPYCVRTQRSYRGRLEATTYLLFANNA